jgi:long-subunit acyl-CoA synthetase (AMP-forming)
MRTGSAVRDVGSERASIDAVVAGLTICDLLARNADEQGDRPAISWKDGGAWRTLTWRQYRERVARVAMGLRSLGVGRGDVVAIMARNRAEHAIADLAAVHLGATPVSFYNTLAPEQIAYAAADARARLAVVEDLGFLERWEKARPELPDLERMVVIEGGVDDVPEGLTTWAELEAAGAVALDMDGGWEAFEGIRRVVAPDDVATLVYTSGTTGAPKGVMITHANVLWTCESTERTTEFPQDVQVLGVSYLPMAHILERVIMWFGLYRAGHAFMCPDLAQVIHVVPEVRPTAFVGPPRVWEKMQAGILAALAEEPNARKRGIALRAIEVGREAVRLQQARRPVPIGLRLRRAVFERLVFSKIRSRVGLDRVVLVATGAAPIAVEILEFFHGIGLRVQEGYGMTENTGLANVNRPADIQLGTVGPTFAGVEERLLDDGELLIRGGHVSPGYHNDPERTAQTFDVDGWLHTGDIATIDADGFASIVDRKKDLIITAGGKNVSPSAIEGFVKLHPLVGQACVIGDRRPYLTALLVLDAEVAPKWATENGLAFTSLAEFVREPRVCAEVQKAVDDANQHVSQVEGIKRFVILPTDWTIDGGELTPTLKLKRRVVNERYAEEIEQLYA